MHLKTVRQKNTLSQGKFGNPGLAMFPRRFSKMGQVKLDTDPTPVEANVGSGAGALHWLIGWTFLRFAIHLEPVCPLFWGETTLQHKVCSNQNKGSFGFQVGGGFNIFYIFTPKIGEDEPILTSIFFKRVETIKQIYFFGVEHLHRFCSDF